MPSMSDVLARIPGYGGFLAKRQLNAQEDEQAMQQDVSMIKIAQALETRKQEAALRQAMAAAKTPEERRALAMQHASPEAILKATQPEHPPVPTPPELIKLQQFMATLPEGHPGRKAIQDRIAILTTRQDPIQVNQFGSPVAGVDAQGNPVFFQPGKQGGTPAIIPGVRPPPKPTDEAGLTPENAGKVAMSQQSIDSIGVVRSKIFDKDGNLNRNVIGAMNLPIVSGLPGNSDARITRSAMRNAVEAKLRLETGAAATESEVERTMARFVPTLADTKESAKFKLDELEKFFKSSLSLTKGIKKPAVAASPSVDELLEKYK